MFEQIASLEYQFKSNMSNSEKIVITINRLHTEYQPVLTAEMQNTGVASQPHT